jgi:O-antigen ligase
MAIPSGAAARRHTLSAEVKVIPISWLFYGFIAMHIPLALVQRTLPIFGAGIQVTVLAVGTFSALISRRSSLPLYCMSYIVGSEVLWRTVDASAMTAWEFGKYGVIAIALTSLLRQPGRRLPILPIAYIILLLPSTTMWLGDIAPLDIVRRRIVGNLLGPLSLSVCAVYFSRTFINEERLRHLAMVILAPVISIATLSLYNIITLGEELQFRESANRLASGGGGPNQVSNTLAFGIILCWLLIYQRKLSGIHRVMISFIMVALSVPMILTLSRGGVFTTIIVVVGTSPFLVQSRRKRIRLLIAGASVMLILFMVVWPRVNQYTAGAAERRYSNLQSSRWDLMRSEFLVFLDNPLLGVGPGHARHDVTQYMGFELQAHVEFTRLLAEHGMFGVVAMIAFFLGFYKRLRYAASPEWRAWVVGAMLFCCTYLMQSATRTVAPCFAYGLMWALWIPYGSQLLQQAPRRISLRRARHW